MAMNSANRGNAGGGGLPWAGKLLAMGLALVVLSLALGRWQGKSSSAGLLGALGNLGWLMLAGAGLIFLLRRLARIAAPRSSSPLPRQVSLPPPSSGFASSLSGASVLDGTSSFSGSSQFAASTGPGELDEAPTKPPSLWSPAVFKVVEWRRFEAVVEALFNQAGYFTQRRRWGGAGEMDLLLYASRNPTELAGLVRCVHGRGKQVGMEKVRDFLRVLAQEKLPQGHYVTATVFTPEGMDYARTHHVTPLNVAGLLELIALKPVDEQKALLKLALEGEYWRPTCVNCGIKLIDRVEPIEGRPYWGCVNYPECKTTMPKRTTKRR